MRIDEPWGKFVCVKVNAIELLQKELDRKKTSEVWISGICDPYQPAEREFRVTRRCLELLISKGWNIFIQTKSHLILDDIDLLKGYSNVTVLITITTSQDSIRKIFEPNAPPISKRIEALKILHEEGIKTDVMIAPLLPGAENLVEILKNEVDHVIVDKMNYGYAHWVYRSYNLEQNMSDMFFREKGNALKRLFEENGIKCELLFR